jgi:ribosomal protein S18 acetylase RimI-like enzyme
MMQIRPSTEEDFTFLRDLHHRAYRDLIVRQFGAWNDEAQDAFFEQSLREAPFAIIEHDGTRIGAIAVREDTEALHIIELQILPEWQNRGIGTALVREQLEAAESRRKPVRLRVLRQNRARELYERLGFAITGQTQTHYFMAWSR